MCGIRLTSTVLLVQLLLVTDVTSQFFDFFGFQPLVQQFQPPRQKTQYVTTESTTKRPNRKKTTTVSYDLHYLDKDDNVRQTSKEEKHRRKTTAEPVLDFNFNQYSSTVKPKEKTHRTGQRNRHKHTNNTVLTTTTINYADSNAELTTKGYNFDAGEKQDKLKKITENRHIYYEKPISSNLADDYYNYTTRYHLETVTKSVYTYNEDNINRNTNNDRNINNFYYVTDYNNNNNDNNHDNNNHQRYTTKNPLHRPGVKPLVIDNRPPITNRPATNRPVTNRRTTKKPIAVFPRPTDAGSISFPEDEDGPEIITGPNEDYMSEVEKRRYIEMAEKMCDKYKSLNTKQLQAIPLIPSPVPVQVNVSSCAPTNIPLVVGGKVVTINEFPHMALLGWVKLENGGYSWKCGGSLISEQYVLTAAHCAYQERDNTVITGAPRVVQLGSSYLDDPGALVVRIAAVIRHPKFKSPKSYYDLALVKLVRSVTFSEVIRPACLGEPPRVGQPIIATGWGQTKFAGDQSLELRSVSLPVWDMESCKNILGTSRKLPEGPMSESQMCAGDRRGGKDTCQGDSGGPAQLQEGCVWRVVAVTSLGRSCGAPNTPGLYSKVLRVFVAAQAFGGHRNGNSNSNRHNNEHGVRNTNEEVNRQQNNDYNRGNNNYNQREGINYNNNGRNVDYNNNNNDKSNENQYYNSPKTYTTENAKRVNDYQNSFGDNYNTNNNNRYNRQQTTGNNNQQTNNGNNHHSGIHDQNHRYDNTQRDSSRDTNQQRDYNSNQQPFNYEINYNQDVNKNNNQQHTNTNHNPQNYGDGGDDRQVDYDNYNNRNRDHKNNNNDYNKQQSNDEGRLYFDRPIW